MLKPLAFALLATGLASSALADLRFCNNTSSTVSVAIGYKDGDSWTSEGWWTTAAGDCTTPIGGDLKNRYYYYRVTSPEIDFPTENYTFCTSPKAFTIVGDENCEDRGYKREMFSELDTGDARSWTVNLTADDGAALQQDLDDGFQQTNDAVYTAMQGFWVDAGDDAIGMRIDDTRLTDYFVGVSAGGADWTVAETCSGANGAGPVLIVTYDDFSDDPLCWVLLDLTSTHLSFRAVGGTGDITMVKK